MAPISFLFLLTGIWLHVEGDNTPLFDGNGYVTGTDRDGTLIPEMKKFMAAAEARNIVVIFVLWNGAVLRNQVLKKSH